MTTLSKFDAAEYLDSPEMIVAYLREAIETGDGQCIAQSISTIERRIASDKASPALS
jgi:DNA-binding phage protein